MHRWEIYPYPAECCSLHFLCGYSGASGETKLINILLCGVGEALTLGMGDLSSRTRVGTCAPCSRSVEP